MLDSTGRTYAAVLPEPVLALQSTSRPWRASGMALRWTRVGFSKLCFATACTRRGSRPSSANDGSASIACFSGWVGSASGAAGADGSSFLSSFRFMVLYGEMVWLRGAVELAVTSGTPPNQRGLNFEKIWGVQLLRVR